MATAISKPAQMIITLEDNALIADMIMNIQNHTAS